MTNEEKEKLKAFAINLNMIRIMNNIAIRQEIVDEEDCECECDSHVGCDHSKTILDALDDVLDENVPDKKVDDPDRAERIRLKFNERCHHSLPCYEDDILL